VAWKWKAIIVALSIVLVAAAAAVIVGGVVGRKFYLDNLRVELPEYPSVQKTEWLNQQWKADEREWFYHADQGTQTFHIPYEWFMALEQPVLSLTAAGLLSDPVYLDHFGFIPDTKEPDNLGLPIGMTRGKAMVDASGSPWKNPETGQDMRRIGLTCAACHTGRFTYQQTAVVIDGGPALTDLRKFQKALGFSLAFTRFVPFRFDRFAEKLMGPGASERAKAELLAQLDRILTLGKALADLDSAVAPQSVIEGFGRLDALNRIGNEVFALDLKIPANYGATSAPVHFPRIWDASWFDWVQYNASIEQPMVRNAGEAMGVSAMINLTYAKGGLYNSGLEINTLHRIEQSLAGPPPQPYERHGFSGLTSPKWPSQILPPIDDRLAADGAVLYKQHCQECHLPPVSSPAFWTDKAWKEPNEAGQWYLHVEVIPFEHIGTDRAQAEDMFNRTVTVPRELEIPYSDFGRALGAVVGKTIEYWYDHRTPPVPPEKREEMNGYRKNGIQAPLGYKVRPLDGIWATPPYLHNGSVPNLYALLSPVAERPKTFYLGHREYDPVNVGYRYQERLDGGFQFDTTIRGNRNTGHEFNDDPKKEGVIGRKLSPDERRALVEYLKTL
jgi:hypothetical protein